MDTRGGILNGALRVRGDVGRKLNNSLTMQFTTGPNEVVADAVQSGGDGTGRKIGVLFGFINGGTGTHELTGADGTIIRVQSREMKSTLFTSGAGAPIGEAERGDETAVCDAQGATVFRVVAHPDDAKSADAFRASLVDGSGTRFGSLDIVRRPAGWSVGRDLVDDVLWFGRAGQSLKIPLLGTNLEFERPPSSAEGNFALAVCVDLAIGLRPYIAAMQ